MRWPGLLVTLAVLAGGTACAGSEGGTPNAEPSGPAGDTRPTTSTTAPSGPGASRPASVDLTGVDPCATLTAEQLTDLGIDRPPSLGGPSGGPLAGAPGCHFNTSTSAPDSYGFSVVLGLSIGLPEYLEQLQDNPSRDQIEVGGFPAVRYEALSSDPATGNGVCFVDVDVADDQLVSVQFDQVAAPPDRRLPVETLCANGVAVAEAVLTTLQDQG